jgi:hypothetical protein
MIDFVFFQLFNTGVSRSIEPRPPASAVVFPSKREQIRREMGKAKGGKGKRPLSSAPKKPEPKINPFERKIVRPKFSVLGRNLKETEKTAGQSRQVATDSVPWNSHPLLSPSSPLAFI